MTVDCSSSYGDGCGGVMVDCCDDCGHGCGGCGRASADCCGGGNNSDLIAVVAVVIAV